MKEQLGFEINLDQPYNEAMKSVKEALSVEGFGVLTEINVKDTLRDKLGIDFQPYSILGACNPPLAHRALTQDPIVGLMLPCNVTVEANPEGGTIIRFVNPEILLTMGNLQDNSELNNIAKEVRERIERVAYSLLDS